MNVGRSLRWHNARVNGARKIANLLWRLRHNGNDFSIISNNCWGGAIYQSLHRPYLSPFAGIFLMAPCYLRLLADLRHYLSRPPRQTTKSQYASVHRVYGPTLPYPLGILDDNIEIHFLHYAAWEEALDKWQRRTERINWDRLFIKFGDQNDSSLGAVQQFLQLSYERKLCLTNRQEVHGPAVVAMKGIGPTTRFQEDVEFRRYMDVPDWLGEGRARGGAGLRRLSHWADGHYVQAYQERMAALLATGESLPMNLDAQLAAMDQSPPVRPPQL